VLDVACHFLNIEPEQKVQTFATSKPLTCQASSTFKLYSPIWTYDVLILPCQFCLKGFEPSWDYKLASCKHAYHSWCVVCHFSTSSKCLNCEENLHADWWVFARIKRLASNEEKTNEEDPRLLSTTLEGT
jgi:hypothetical protein